MPRPQPTPPAPRTRPRRKPAAASASHDTSSARDRAGARIPGLHEIPCWPHLKLDIVREYARAYSTIQSRQPGLAHYYVEGFSGPCVHVSSRAGDFVPGSPLNALLVQPPFRHHYLMDLDGGHVSALRAAVGARDDVTLLGGDWNEILLGRVFPQVRYEDYRRALCLLDPCGLHPDWRLIETAGRLRTIDLFVCLPVVDAGCSALWAAPERITARDAARMTRFWGDETWREAAAPRPGPAIGRRRGPDAESPSASTVVEAFHRRLREVARFANVPEPLALRDAAGAVVSHLFFAARTDTANRIIEDIFSRHRGGTPGAPGPSATNGHSGAR